MNQAEVRAHTPRVVVLADVASNAQGIIDRTLEPAGIRGWVESETRTPQPDVILVDVTQLRGDPLAGLRARRNGGDQAPAIVLAAHFPATRLRELFQLGVADILMKPYRGVDLCKAIYALTESRSAETTTKLLARRLEASREQSRRRSEEIRMLSEIGRTVASLEDLDEILKRVVEAGAFLTGAEEAHIYLAEPNSETVVLRASMHVGQRQGTLQRLRITDTLAGEVYRTAKPVVRQPQSDSPGIKVQTGFLVQSLIKVPIRARHKVVGVLGVYNRLAQRSFTDHHVTLLMALADWAGVALEQTSLRSNGNVEHPPAAPPAKGEAAQPRGRPEPQPKPAKPEPEMRPQPQPARVTKVSASLVTGLEAALRDLDDLLHQPLAAMPAYQREQLERVRETIKAISQLPMTVMETSRLGGHIDLADLARQVGEDLRPAARVKGLDLIVEKSASVPRIVCDRDRAYRVIEALVASAVRRTDRGRVSVGLNKFAVRLGRSQQYPLPVEPRLADGLWVALRVADSSRGLSPDTLSALTSASAEPSEGKQGPGLSMGEIRMIAESLGGMLWDEKAPGSHAIVFALPAE